MTIQEILKIVDACPAGSFTRLRAYGEPDFPMPGFQETESDYQNQVAAWEAEAGKNATEWVARNFLLEGRAA